ncbi:MAG: hypothetical protein WCP21_15245 [Armatimonadota bacterium]
MKTSARLLVTMVLLLAAASLASAEVLTHGDPTGISNDYSFEFTTNEQTATPAILVPQFNITGAHLNSVKVTVWDRGYGTIVVTNSGQPGSGNVNLTAHMIRRYTITVPGVSSGMPNNVAYSPAGPTFAVVNLAPGAQVSRLTELPTAVWAEPTAPLWPATRAPATWRLPPPLL